jgi:hypothetical protein
MGAGGSSSRTRISVSAVAGRNRMLAAIAAMGLWSHERAVAKMLGSIARNAALA